MNCLYLRLVTGPERLTDHDQDQVLVNCGLHFVHGAKRQLERLVLNSIQSHLHIVAIHGWYY